ncbi:sodium:proton exchanger [Rhodobacterales bacterium 52_120_T64]|nr:sodium:proton exchanger [Rhodobacterales bacterium 52_120_T64]
MDMFLVLAGLVILLVAGDFLVKGAVSLSLRLGIPALIVSFTIVGFGTSAPELLIAIQSALEDAPGLALGNVVGSNIANVLLVLGVPALLFTLDTRRCDAKRTYIQMIAASVVFTALCFLGPLYIWHGLVLLALLAAMLGDAFCSARKSRRCEDVGCVASQELSELEDADPNMAIWKVAAYMVAGIIGLPFGAHILIEGALGIAHDKGVPEEIIGLTIVAIGTSLPELATTVVAALRRQADVALGNVIGSNMFNLLAIMGIASFFGPLEVAPRFLQGDLWIMLASSLALALFVFFRLQLSRIWGFMYLTAYVVYILVMLQ